MHVYLTTRATIRLFNWKYHTSLHWFVFLIVWCTPRQYCFRATSWSCLIFVCFAVQFISIANSERHPSLPPSAFTLKIFVFLSEEDNFLSGAWCRFRQNMDNERIFVWLWSFLFCVWLVLAHYAHFTRVFCLPIALIHSILWL